MNESTQDLDRIAGLIGRQGVRTDPNIRAQYAVDGLEPGAVAFPRDIREVSAVVREAHRQGLALVPRGSGSKGGMGLPPRRLDLVLCTSRMNHMTDVDSANLTITVEAGVGLRDIQRRLAGEEDRCYLPLEEPGVEGDDVICSDRSHHGCFLPLDPPSGELSSIGGILACNASGPKRLLYGLPRDIVLGVRFVAPDGEIVGAGGKTVKNVSGYDVSKLMIGSAGSLGVLCETTLRILPLPERMETVLVSFETLDAANAFAGRILDSPLLPAALEILNPSACAGLEPGLPAALKTGGYLVAAALESFAEAVQRMETEIRQVAGRCKTQGAATLGEEDHRRFWQALGNLESRIAGRHPALVSARLTYPLAARDALTAWVAGRMSAAGLAHTLQIHAGSGVCLLGLPLDREEGEGVDRALQALGEALKRCRESGGNLVIGRAPLALKDRLPMWGETGADFTVMQRLKMRLDPGGIMSPGRFLGGL